MIIPSTQLGKIITLCEAASKQRKSEASALLLEIADIEEQAFGMLTEALVS